jgi:hypothetical protein
MYHDNNVIFYFAEIICLMQHTRDGTGINMEDNMQNNTMKL